MIIDTRSGWLYSGVNLPCQNKAINNTYLNVDFICLRKVLD